MRVQSKSLTLCVLGLSLALAGGCGGGGGGSTSVGTTNASRQGSMTMTIKFPKPLPPKKSVLLHRAARSRYQAGEIPDGSYAVKIDVTDAVTNNPVAPTRIVTAPLSNSTGSLPPSITINYAALPAGDVYVAVSAHGLPDASDPPLATGNGSATIVPLSTTVVHILLGLTANSITMVPPNQVISFGQPGSVTATVFDASGRPLLTPLQFSINDPEVDITPNGTSPATATLTVNTRQPSQTSATVTVLEPDSGLTTTVDVVIQ